MTSPTLMMRVMVPSSLNFCLMLPFFSLNCQASRCFFACNLGLCFCINDCVENQKNKGLKILIAEDDETSEMLTSITVKEFSKEAIEICRTNPDLDLILMDFQMPDLNGYEATQQIRQFNKVVVIIAQAAYGLSGDREKAIEAGCNDYISKPINKDEMLSLIQKHFKK